ncbi:MAG: hypothetical protein M0R02_12110, partial [Bacteroidales bacterium]|nr:hypothetical protein [Bacteroidales bacterium]
RPGMLLFIRLASEPRLALQVSEQALIQEGSQRYVFVVDDESRVERRTVDIGQRLAGSVEIIAGLAEGEQVIIEGSQKVRDGTQVSLASEA